MKVSDFDFDLPEHLIAQEPPSARGASRLLVLDKTTGGLTHEMFSDLPRHLGRGDLLILNDTRVFPARLLGHRVPSGGAVECLLLSETPGGEALPSANQQQWMALMHPGQKLAPGARVVFEGDGVRLHGEVLGRHFHGRRTIRLWTDAGPVSEAIEVLGHMPLPPYISRADRPEDRDRYQTVFARHRGSIAAPTAGLHFTASLLEEMRSLGVEVVEVTLHVGYGTFKPVRVSEVEEHEIDAERYSVGADAAAALTRAREAGRRVIAVGTTSTRVLESLQVDEPGHVRPSSGETTTFIYPGHRFQLVDGLVTNFHLPRSSLLMLVSALAGRENLLRAYREAVERGYRFYSYGDAMLIV